MTKSQHFVDREGLASALADAVAKDLVTGIKARDSASIAVSGGSTPAAFFAQLAAHTDVDWPRVVITLVDERWVDENSDRSNGRLVKQNLLQGPASKASFVPLYAGGDAPTGEGIARTNQLQEKVPHPFDAVILGMGNDGHTASFFPGGDTLAAALTDPGPALAIQAPGAGEPRVTLTLPYLLATTSLYLHIEGAQKAKTLALAQADGPLEDMPVRAVLRQTTTPVEIYWCP